jgi:hypothetical protein
MAGYVEFKDGEILDIDPASPVFDYDKTMEGIEYLRKKHGPIIRSTLPKEEFDVSYHTSIPPAVDGPGVAKPIALPKIRPVSPLSPGSLGGFPDIMSPERARERIDTPMKQTGEMAGGALGALGGGAVGHPILGAIAGAGEGRARMAQAADWVGEKAGLPPRDSNLMKERAIGAAWEAGGQAVGSIARFTRHLLSSGRPVSEIKEASRLLKNIGIDEVDQMGFQVSDSPIMGTVTQWAVNHPGSAKIVSRDLRDQMDKVLQNIDGRLRRRLGGRGERPLDVAQTAATAEAALKRTQRGEQGWRLIGNQQYDSARAMIPSYETQTWRPTKFRETVTSMPDELAQIMNAERMPADLNAVFKQLTDPSGTGQIVVPGGDSVSAPIKITQLEKMKQALARAEGNLDRLSSDYTKNQRLIKEARGALKEDIYDAYKHYGGDTAEKSIRDADRYWAANKEFDNKYLKGIAKKANFSSPIKMYREMESAISGLDAQTMGAIKSRLGKDEWEHIVDQYIQDRLITGRGRLDFDSFLAMRDKLGRSPSMEQIVFGKKGSADRQYWDDVTKYFEDNSALLKQSETAFSARKGGGMFSNVAIYGPLMLGSATGGGLLSNAKDKSVAGGAVAGGLAGAAAVTLAIMAPRAAWRLVKQPKFMRIITALPEKPGASTLANVKRIAAISDELDTDEQQSLVEFLMTMEQMYGTEQKRQGSPLMPARSALGGM